MRKKKHAAERLDACSEYFYPGRDNGLKKPLRLEIGCGKGAFILEAASREPDVEFVAIEKVSDVMLIAAEKVKAAGVKNVHFLCCDAKQLPELFGEGEISRIYLNFSDPWPKSGYYKRRLTYKDFLDIYRPLLIEGGEIWLKTDSRPLFDFSVEQLSANGFEVNDITYDLHNSEYAADNIVTEYETAFSQKGFTINRLTAKKI